MKDTVPAVVEKTAETERIFWTWTILILGVAPKNVPSNVIGKRSVFEKDTVAVSSISKVVDPPCLFMEAVLASVSNSTVLSMVNEYVPGTDAA